MTAATQVGEESPGTTGERCRVTPGGPGSDFWFRDSATESKPPMCGLPQGKGTQARLKGCGKSAPQTW
jgi:hypothetical protein